MGNFLRKAGTELRQLPLMLGKLLGGLAAVIGIGMASWVATHGKDGDVWLPFLAGVAGLAVFVVSARRLTRRAAAAKAPPSSPGEMKRSNFLAWLLLLLLLVVFLLCIKLFLQLTGTRQLLAPKSVTISESESQCQR
ncbi:MAG: hypothetical protein R2940_15245 [Syntrophotaleaceae bacterium]